MLIEHKYALVEWVGEDSSSVVPCIQVGGGTYRVGEVTNVKTSGSIFNALVAAVGKSSDYSLLVIACNKHEYGHMHASKLHVYKYIYVPCYMGNKKCVSCA